MCHGFCLYVRCHRAQTPAPIPGLRADFVVLSHSERFGPELWFRSFRLVHLHRLDHVLLQEEPDQTAVGGRDGCVLERVLAHEVRHLVK